ncbi:glycogen synthase [Parasediminibacterium sp. JCM 36343]|uniref:glycogen synthase n=1 Tax=Parasediminibacterium sp. JCM 36343 TaxID=3374279 RepID=UPI0039792046
MEIIHVSAECYPVAKAGGLGDVVGALPKYQCKAGHFAKVVMPMYRTKFLYNNEWVVDFKGSASIGIYNFNFTIIKEKTNKLGFDLYLVDIHGLLDREKIYGYSDDTDRFIAFQIAVLTWLNSWQHQPHIIHVHDYHAGLIPFMLKNCYAFRKLAFIKTVLTIHNAQYQGNMGWDRHGLIPEYDSYKWGDLDWKGQINPLASAIKCAWVVTTVSESYMAELRYKSNGLEALFEYEKGKCRGILNGIDNEVWNPETDPYLTNKFSVKGVAAGKKKNKKKICEEYGLDENLPLFVFIGRLVGEKAADILPGAFHNVLYHQHGKACYMILGSGEKAIEAELASITASYKGFYNTQIGYDEALSHRLYAAADFLLMPSRVEPCGLNQMYALRYGTVPVVRSTGGLQDTVKDMGEWEGFGIRFNNATVSDIAHSVYRGIEVYKNKTHMDWMRKYMMRIDHSWESVVEQYTEAYGN